MKKLVGNLLYGQSGGPTSIINSSAYGLFKSAFKNKKYIKKVYAMHYGIEGLLKEDLILIKNTNKLKDLITTPGAFFGSNRYKLKDYQEDEIDYQKIFEIIKKYNIRYIFYNGGNDSMDTIKKIGEYILKQNYEIKVFGIPKTIDNDLYNEHFSLGFISSSKFINNAIKEIYYDDISYKKGRVNFIETMGRNAGWLAASSLYLKNEGIEIDLIYVPELFFDIDDFLNKVKEIYNKKGHCLVVISEGIKNKDHQLIFEASKEKDQFNHNALGGISHYLASLVQTKLNFKVRAFELSLLQRASALTQDKNEVNLAIKLSAFILKNAIKNDINFKVGTISFINNKFVFGFENLEKIANYERKLDEKYLDFKNNQLKEDEILKYLEPFYQKGTFKLNKNGLFKSIKNLTK